MERNPPKASSVTADGTPDGWLPSRSWRAQVAPDGSTRLVVSVPAEELPEIHLRILRSMKAPLSVAYMQLTDRVTGVTHPAPQRFVGLEMPTERVIAAIEAAGDLVWYDGRHQLWVRGNFGEQVVLDELGVIYCYPDDPHFRDVLEDIPESTGTGMDSRDYVRVSFRAAADKQEKRLIEGLNLVKWGGR
ncbi:MAG TPA: hypothetical protein PLA94_09790 [Myxococcota bacterium]|nr:hypothetical protein [Myxococcota bacterium]HND30281.1 hypothetical protein [Myxococcota bacterium]